VKKTFRPEFPEPRDDVIFFKASTKKELAHIVEIQIGRPGKTAPSKTSRWTWKPREKVYSAKEGYDPQFARARSNAPCRSNC